MFENISGYSSINLFNEDQMKNEMKNRLHSEGA